VPESDPHPPIGHLWASDQPLFVRVRQVVAHPSSLKIIKYSAVSIISTVVSQLTLFLVFDVFSLTTEVPANIIANVLATVPSYSLNRKWVWGKSGQSHFWREVAPFWILSFIGLTVSSLAVWGAGAFARHHHLHHFGTGILVNGANLASFAILWVGKFLIYNKLFHIAPIEFDEDLEEDATADPAIIN
jgi:putative flippase GtrA